MVLCGNPDLDEGMKMMKKGLVSIVIPSHNGSDKVARAVKSVLNQTYKDVEVIVVDDNGIGTEEQIKTEKVLSEFKKYPNFRYITHEVNKNGSAARNTGARAAEGEFIGLLDDDDIYLPHNIETHMERFKTLSEDYALTYCSLEEYRGDTFIKEYHKKKSGSLFYDVMRHFVVIGSSLLVVRKSAYDAVGGFDESFRRHQDWEFTAKIAHKYKVSAIDVIGVRGYLEYRNSPKNYEAAKKYRIHYIEKMKPYMQSLTKKQQKEIITANYVGLLMQLLRKGKIVKFVKEYSSFKLGFYGIPFVLRYTYFYFFKNKNFWTLNKRK